MDYALFVRLVVPTLSRYEITHTVVLPSPLSLSPPIASRIIKRDRSFLLSASRDPSLTNVLLVLFALSRKNSHIVTADKLNRLELWVKNSLIELSAA